jgi:hypothetical protein
MGRALTQIRGFAGRPRLVLLAAAMLLPLPTACSGSDLDVGSGAQGGGAGASNQAPTTAGTSGMAQSCSVTTSPPWPEPAACRAAPGSPLVGTWKAHWPLVSENDSFGVDNTAVLTVSGLTADGTPCGTLRIGDGAPLPEASDPTAPYPPAPASPPASGMLLGPQFGSALPDTYPGFAYSLVGVISDGTRLAFRVEIEEPWRGWCALQKPPYAGSVTSCLGPIDGLSCGSDSMPGAAFAASCSDESGRAIPYAQGFLCGQYNLCHCQAGCCDGSTAVWAFPLELHRQSDGTLQGSVRTETPIYFDPVP